MFAPRNALLSVERGGALVRFAFELLRVARPADYVAHVRVARQRSSNGGIRRVSVTIVGQKDCVMIGTTACRPGSWHMPLQMRTARLLVRCWGVEDAPALREAIDASLPELQMWVPWAMSEPTSLEALRVRLGDMRRKFLAGEDWPYGIFDPAGTRVLGGTGLHARVGNDALEIGYWIRTSHVGHGYATEAADAMCVAAFGSTTITRVEIRCDARNHRSAAVPQRLGFQLLRTFREHAMTAHAAERETLVWARPRADFERQHQPERRAPSGG